MSIQQQKELHQQNCYFCHEQINGFKVSHSNENGKYFCLLCLLKLEKRCKQLNNDKDDYDYDYEHIGLKIEYKINFCLPKSDTDILSDVASNRIINLTEKLIEETDSEDETRTNKKVRKGVKVQNNQNVLSKSKRQKSTWKNTRPTKSEKCQPKRPKARLNVKSDDLTCRVCFQYFSSKDERLIHVKQHRDDKTKLYNCPNCDYSSKLSYLGRHCRTQVCIKRQKSKTQDKAINCRLCKLPFFSHEMRSQHEIDVHLDAATNLYNCSECKYANKDSNNVLQHMRRIHEKGGFTICRICNQREFATQQLRNIHEVDAHMDHSSSTYPCLECNTSFVDKNEYICHLREHSGATISICPVCGKNFGSDYSLSCHMDTHNMTKEFQCDTCGKSFNSKNRVHIHLKTHNSDKRYQCDLCDKSYKGHTDLRRHKYTHGLIEPRYVCNVCGKKFFEPKFLRAHMKQHGL